MSPSDEEKWQKRYNDAEISGASAALVLTRYAHLLPPSGKALDLACGLGANALLLAQHGLTTSAWDISSNAIEKLSQHADRTSLSLHCEVRDVVARPPEAEGFDVIVVSRFLARTICPAISAALKPGGLLFYQTFLQDRTDPSIGPRNPEYLLGQNELLQLFDKLVVRAYHEEGSIGDMTRGTRNEALLVAQRTPL